MMMASVLAPLYHMLTQDANCFLHDTLHLLPVRHKGVVYVAIITDG